MHSIVLEDNSNSLRYWIYTLIITTYRMDKEVLIARPRALHRALLFTDSLYVRDERNVEGLRLPKRRGLHSSRSQPQPKLRSPRHRCAHTAHWKYMMESQTKYLSYRDIQRSLLKLHTGMIVASALWRRSIWKHNQAYRRLSYMKNAKMHKLIRSSYHCIHSSWSDRRFMEERNKIHSFNTRERIGGRKSGGKTIKDTM